jgi:uncharacterized damage-inducible protein DinB
MYSSLNATSKGDSMSAVQYMKQSLAFIHGSYRQAAEGLSPEQLHFVPEGESHSIAWIIWHGARVEDLIVQQVIKGGPQEWEAGGWADRTGLPAKSFGTGQSTEEARAVRVEHYDEFAQYAAKVATLTQSHLSSLTDDDLERELQVGQRKESVGQAITLHLVTHLNGHRGEINLLRGMMGFPPVLPNQGG